MAIEWSVWATRLALAGLLAAAACSGSEPAVTQALIEVNADPTVIEKLTAIEVETYDVEPPASSANPIRIGGARFTKGASDERGLHFPFSFGVEKRRAGRFLLIVTGYERDVLVIERKLQLTFIEGEARVAKVLLPESCYARGCSEPGQPDWFTNTCGEGTCSEVTESPSTPLGPEGDADASVSTVRDAGSSSDRDGSAIGVAPTRDASAALDATAPRDATVDASPYVDAAARDAGARDAGTDAGPAVLGGFVRVSHDNFEARFGGFTGDSRGYPVTARSGPCLLQTRSEPQPMQTAGTLTVTRKGMQVAMLQADASSNYYYGWTFMNFVTSANDNVREQGPLVVAASGGQVPAFSVQLDVPQSEKAITVPTTLKRGQDLLVQWNPALLAEKVTIDLIDPANREVHVSCAVPAAPGRFAVPASLLSTFPDVELRANVGGLSEKTIDAGPYKIVVFVEAPLIYKTTLQP